MDMPSIQSVREFFFKAMLEGYATSGQKIRIVEMPGYKAIPFRDGDWYLLDLWSKTEGSECSSGTTTIWFHDVPVWVMHYGGRYTEEAVLFLKEVLKQTYESKQFFCGRGPACYRGANRLVYRNIVHHIFNDFSHFEGFEEIRNDDGRVGWHKYRGMSLMPKQNGANNG